MQDSPLFKQVSFGRMQVRDIRRLLSRVPELSKAYGIRNPGRVSRLLAEAGSLLLEGDNLDLVERRDRRLGLWLVQDRKKVPFCQ